MSSFSDPILQSKLFDDSGVRNRNVTKRHVTRTNNQSIRPFYILETVKTPSKNPPVTALSN